MRNSRLITFIIGIFIIYIGVSIFLNTLGFNFYRSGSIFPIILLLLGYWLFKKKKRILSYILLGLGGIIFFDEWLGIQPDEIIGFIIAFGFLFLGYRMIRSKQKKVEIQDENGDQVHGQSEEESTQTNEESTEEKYAQSDLYIRSPKKKHSLIGNCFLTGSRWELKDMDIWHGIGEVKIDLSRASIPEQKTTIVINGWVGDIDIYIPYDLEFSIIAHVSMGDIDIFGNKEGGLNQSTTLETNGYRHSVKRVEIVIHLLVGDIDVTRL